MQNVSAEKVLRMVYEEVIKPVDSQLKQAWLDTPYVKRWHVSVHGTQTEFSTICGKARYTIEVSANINDAGATVAELFLEDTQIHTFAIPQPYYNVQTAESLTNLAEAITEAWRDAVLDEHYGE